MLELKEATRKAVERLTEFYPDAKKVQLEEAEITDDDKFYNITLSYESSSDSSGFVISKLTKYKIFKIDANSGEVRSMKIREMK